MRPFWKDVVTKVAPLVRTSDGAVASDVEPAQPLPRWKCAAFWSVALAPSTTSRAWRSIPLTGIPTYVDASTWVFGVPRRKWAFGPVPFSTRSPSATLSVVYWTVGGTPFVSNTIVVISGFASLLVCLPPFTPSVTVLPVSYTSRPGPRLIVQPCVKTGASIVTSALHWITAASDAAAVFRARE